MWNAYAISEAGCVVVIRGSLLEYTDVKRASFKLLVKLLLEPLASEFNATNGHRSLIAVEGSTRENCLHAFHNNGAIDATLDNANGWMVSKETGDIYSTNEPQAPFNSRNAFCLNMRALKRKVQKIGGRRTNRSSRRSLQSILPRRMKMTIKASKKLNFKTTRKPDSIFFKSKGLYGSDLANFFSIDPRILKYRFNKVVIQSFDKLKSIVQSDQNVVKMLKRNSWILSTNQVEKVMVNLEHLRTQGVPETKISDYLIRQPRVFTEDANKFRKIVERTKEMGFNPLKTTFLVAIHGLTSMTEANWRKKKGCLQEMGLV
ncbi:hypothetical protein C5167_044962 [Papaver somniferum]|uniref:Uncharacterized protein n=1 Tax=Papaver somniferum TaxID=3469 RepID=A0A4Y7LDA8_PAPSO|nr:hypothetical protein C5167_044962 [Papaver somniferum]